VTSRTGGAADKKCVFALVPKNMNNPFFDQARDGCKKADKDLNGAVECLYIGQENMVAGKSRCRLWTT
jgi:ribose transport system substrate-binding protein